MLVFVRRRENVDYEYTNDIMLAATVRRLLPLHDGVMPHGDVIITDNNGLALRSYASSRKRAAQELIHYGEAKHFLSEYTIKK